MACKLAYTHLSTKVHASKMPQLINGASDLSSNYGAEAGSIRALQSASPRSPMTRR
jgi:hypothetical protein